MYRQNPRTFEPDSEKGRLWRENRTSFRPGLTRFARSWHWTPGLNGPVTHRFLTDEELRNLS